MASPRIGGRLLLRMTEVATLLGLGRSTVYELVQRGELPVIHVGRAVRVPTDALERWIELRRAEAEGESGHGRGRTVGRQRITEHRQASRGRQCSTSRGPVPAGWRSS